MIKNQDRFHKDLSHLLADGAVKIPILSENKNQIKLINEHAFDNQDIMNPSYNLNHVPPIQHSSYQTQGKKLNGSQVISEINKSKPIPQTSELFNDPLFQKRNISGNGVTQASSTQPPSVASNSTASSLFQSLSGIPRWILILACLAIVVLVVYLAVWTSNRTGAPNNILMPPTNSMTAPVPSISPTTTPPQIPNTINQNMNTPVSDGSPPVIEQKKITSVDQGGNAIQKTTINSIRSPDMNSNIIGNGVTQQPTDMLTMGNTTSDLSSIVQTKRVELVNPSLSSETISEVSVSKRVVCPANSYNLNNRCYICPIGKSWDGSNCVSVVRHLRRRV